MKVNKVEDCHLDKFVGGIIHDGGMAISIDGDNIVGVRSNEVITMSVTDCKEALIEEGFS